MLIQALQLILSLSILVVLHEAGHFFPARWFGVRVKKFYLFFDFLFPFPNLANFSLLKIKRGDTVYGIGWFPFGGYVQLDGMVDETQDAESMSAEPQPHEFRAKPAWQRLIIMVGGVTVNLILGFLIYIMVMGVWGEDKLPIQNVEYGYAYDTVMQQYGLEDGDVILSLNGEEPENALDISKLLLLDDIRTIEYDRNGTKGVAQLPAEFGQLLLDSGVRRAVTPRMPTFVSSILAGSNADKAGLAAGDNILAVDDTETPYFNDFSRVLQLKKNSEVSLRVADSLGQERQLTAMVSDDGTLGFRRMALGNFIETVHVDYSGMECLGAGWKLGKEKLSDYVISIKFIFSKAGIKQMGGFGAIGGMFAQGWDWERFWLSTAFISLILAFMNILPIPMLDGGYVMFLLWEMITGKEPPQRFMEVAQMIGMLFLLTLLVYANGNDLYKLLTGK